MTDWRDRGACRADPDMWFTGETRTAAVHICLAHCPVIRDCREWTETATVCSGVAGGQAFGADGAPMTTWGGGQDVKVCGPACRPYRGVRDRTEG